MRWKTNINLAEPDEDNPEVANEGQETLEDNNMTEHVERNVELEEVDDDELGVAQI